MADGDGHTKALTPWSIARFRLLTTFHVRPWASHNLFKFQIKKKSIKSLKSLKVNIQQNPDTGLPSVLSQRALFLFHIQQSLSPRAKAWQCNCHRKREAATWRPLWDERKREGEAEEEKSNGSPFMLQRAGFWSLDFVQRLSCTFMWHQLPWSALNGKINSICLRRKSLWKHKPKC